VSKSFQIGDICTVTSEDSWCHDIPIGDRVKILGVAGVHGRQKGYNCLHLYRLDEIMAHTQVIQTASLRQYLESKLGNITGDL
jgi:hypothetical protein